MKKKILAGVLMAAMTMTVFTGCGSNNDNKPDAIKPITVLDIFDNMSEDKPTSCNTEFGLNFKGDASITSNNDFTDLVIEQIGSGFDYDLTQGISLNADITGNGSMNMTSDVIHTKFNTTFDVSSNVDALNEMLSSSITDNAMISESYIDLKENLTYTCDSEEEWYVTESEDSDLNFGFSMQDFENKELMDALSKIGTFSEVRSSGDAYVFDFEFKMTDDMTDEQKENIEQLFELTTMKNSEEDVVESGVDTDSLFAAFDTFSGFGSMEMPVKVSFTFLKSNNVYNLSATNIDVTCDMNVDATEEVIMMLTDEFMANDSVAEFGDLDCEANIDLALNFNIRLSVGYDDVTIVIPEEAKNGTDFSDIYFNSDDFEE